MAKVWITQDLIVSSVNLEGFGPVSGLKLSEITRTTLIKDIKDSHISYADTNANVRVYFDATSRPYLAGAFDSEELGKEMIEEFYTYAASQVHISIKVYLDLVSGLQTFFTAFYPFLLSSQGDQVFLYPHFDGVRISNKSLEFVEVGKLRVYHFKGFQSNLNAITVYRDLETFKKDFSIGKSKNIFDLGNCVEAVVTQSDLEDYNQVIALIFKNSFENHSKHILRSLSDLGRML